MTLKRFKAEVVDKGAEACLPCNLSDEWLDVVARSADDMVEGVAKGTGAIAMAAVVTILFAKTGGERLDLSCEEMFSRLQDFRIELAFEEVYRRTEVKYEPATLATVFTNRAVKTGREERSD